MFELTERISCKITVKKSSKRQRTHEIYRGSLSMWELVLCGEDVGILGILGEGVVGDDFGWIEHVVMPSIYIWWLLTSITWFGIEYEVFGCGKLPFLL